MYRPAYNTIKLIRWRKLPRYGYAFPSATKVLSDSPISFKNALETYAYYFRREFHYDFVQYAGKGHTDDLNLKAYIFPDPKGKFYWVGGCMFRRKIKDIDNSWLLSWVWVHPQYRGMGVVARAWDAFEEEIGDFEIEAPVSVSMQYFLLKRNFPEAKVQGGYKIKLK